MKLLKVKLTKSWIQWFFVKKYNSSCTKLTPSPKSSYFPYFIRTVGIIMIAIGLVQCSMDNFNYIEPTISMTSTTLENNTYSTKPYIKMVTIPGRNIMLSETEVTIGQYLAFCRETNSHWPEWLEKDNIFNINTGSDNYYSSIGMSESNENYPITGVSALDADAFCKWMGGRLPKEGEWEYAAKGGESYEYASSDNIDAVAWYGGNSGGKAHKVRGKSPNGYGLYDMTGNLWEWTSSKEGVSRVFRGGSWFSPAAFCRVSNRYYYPPGSRNFNLGFRIAIDQ